MAARTAQEAEVLNVSDALAFIGWHGVVCEAARHPAIPSLVAAVAGAPVRGNWWSHPRARDIFAITRAVREAPDVLTCRIVGGKVSFVHVRLWPALVRVAGRFPRKRLARIREIHTAGGRHVLEETPFPEWVPRKVQGAAARMNAAEALRLLGPDLV